MTPPRFIRVLIVDDSATARRFLREAFSVDPAIQVVGSAADAYQARDLIKKLRPQVITLDVEMPGLDGLTFLKTLMANNPLPVVMVSSYTAKGAQITFRALALGAVDFVTKPSPGLTGDLSALAAEIRAKVRAGAGARIARPKQPPAVSKVPPKLGIDQVLPLETSSRALAPPVVLMGASTGGTVALEKVLSALPAQSPAIAVVQHMPERFTGPFAQRLNERCAITVAEAVDRQPLPPGTALIAPAGRHMLLERKAQGYWVRIKDAPPVNRHRPSVDVLFRSAVNSAGAAAMAVLMTGMGDDGAQGMADLHSAGALTLAQSEATCTVYGMLRVAVERGVVKRIVHLEQIAGLIRSRWPERA